MAVVDFADYLRYIVNTKYKGGQTMEKVIAEKLKEIEKEQGVKIILAVESGSRAWGFASPDSDYDVRFIYYRPKNEYLRLDDRRDVIELPINDLLDINGWDLDKALKLLYRSNPTLFEWLSSPIVYKSDSEIEAIKSIAKDYFSIKKGLYHYLSMAKNNYREHMKKEMVKAKKYFYILRPILACRWILDKGTPPPMLFSELMDSELDKSLIPYVNELLDIKMNSPEIKEIKKMQPVNDYIEKSLEELQRRIDETPVDYNEDWSTLNNLFLKIIE